MSGGNGGLQLQPDLVAAVLWDLPTLQAGDAAARNLVAAFRGEARNFDEGATGPLQQAAEGVAKLVAGGEQAALESWAGLVASEQAGDRLFGHLLRLLVSTEPDARQADLEAAQAIAATLAESDVRARVTRKIAIVALESGHAEVVRTAVEDVLGAVRVDSRIGRSLRWLLWSAGDREVDLGDGDGQPDPLLDQPWLAGRAFAGAAKADVNRLLDDLNDVWGGTIRFGRTPIDILNAAQLQADWAGDLALRNSIVQVMAAHIFAAPQMYRANVQWAATSWVVSGGQQISSVLRHAEPYLDADAVTAMVDAVLAKSRAIKALPKVAVGTWRLASDAELGRLLDLLDPGDLTDSTRDDARLVWASVIWRDPTMWLDRWRHLDGSHQLGALVELPPDVADELPSAARSELLDACARAAQHHRSTLAGLAAALAWKAGQPVTPWVETAPTATILDLLRWNPDTVAERSLRQHLEDAKRLVSEQREAALAGRFELRGTDARASLGALVAADGKPDIDAERLLIAVAEDPQMSGEHQVNALQGLTSIRRAGLLSSEARTQLRSMPGEQGRHHWGPIDTGAVRAARLLALADDLKDTELDELLAGARSSAEQVRLISIAALEDVLESHASNTAAAWTLISALYDPSDEILISAASAIARGALRSQSEARSVAITALIAAYRNGRESVRYAAVSAAWILREQYSGATELVRTASADQSWVVRRAADGWAWRQQPPKGSQKVSR